MDKIYLVLFFIWGSIMGSFYHVIATRLSNGKSIVKPPSHCEVCQKQLRWYELIPIVSYIIQGGKCLNCKSKIPLSYLLIEVCTGILFAVSYHVFGFSLKLIEALIFISSLIIIIVSDIEYMIILDEVIVVASFSIIIIKILDVGLYESALMVASGIGAFLTMILIKKIGDFMFKQESLGGGDIKLMFLVGLVIGYSMSICNIFLATFIAFPIALGMLLLKKDNIIPFGPFLSMSAIILYMWGITFTEVITFLIT